MNNDKLTYELNNEIVILHFPEVYGVSNWGEMLELVFKKTLLGSKYIIIDLSKVTGLEDCGDEFYILRSEFRNIGGKDILIAGMPPFFQNIHKLLEDDRIKEKIKMFKNIDEAISSIVMEK